MKLNERSWVDISLTDYEHNLCRLRRFLNTKKEIMQIVKADAYGHGAYQIALHAEKIGISMLGVANAEEGALLRFQGIKLPILILSPSLQSEIDKIIEYGLIPTVNDKYFLESFNKSAKRFNKKLPYHINIDTGMGRSGIEYKKAFEFINHATNCENIILEGIFSHYAESEKENDFTKLQLEKFKRIVKSLTFKCKYLHISNSSGVINYPDEVCNLVRIGILSFGLYTDDSIKEKIDLKQIMTFKSKISQIKKADKNTSIGYNRTFKTNRKIKYAIIPIGYADGYDYLLSNNGKVLINEKLCSVIGKVSMDMIAVDITNTECHLGDEAILLGPQHPEITAFELVKSYGGSNYELVSQIGRRAKRYYWINGKFHASTPLSRRDFYPKDFSDDKLNFVVKAAVEQRLQSNEITKLLYSEFIRRFFADKDKDVSYRRNFDHHICFKEMPGNNKLFKVQTKLSYRKRLDNSYFLVVCAIDHKALSHYFMKRDVEYRWLLNSNFSLSEEYFKVSRIKVNDYELDTNIEFENNCLIIRCSHDKLSDLVGEDVQFNIDTETFYPRDSHQLSVYISEITKGAKISFTYPKVIKSVETINIFSGENKYPQRIQKNNKVEIDTKDKWIYPNSGVVFTY